MPCLKFSTIGLCFLSCGNLYFTLPLNAQIIPDRTLGNENSVVIPSSNIQGRIADAIEGGAIRGNNLFHSFEQFSIEKGNAVYFNNPEGIANILSRVTGNNISEIFGTLGVNGTANLFLLNPNGIVFGEHSSIDVNGSFLATTAESYLFENGSEYSATIPNAPPLLTINIPVGLQTGTNLAPIKVKGKGNNLAQEEFTLRPLRDNRPVGLEVKPGKTLALLGGEINLIGGNLTAAKGNIELGSVRENNIVSLNPTNENFTLNYQGISSFGDLNFKQASSLDTSGNSGGNINLRGRNISVLENSAIIANTLGADNGGNITVFASNSIEIISSADDASFASSISAFSEGKGDAGNLSVKGKNLVVRNGGRIDGGAIDLGKGGNVTIDVEKIELTGVAPDGSYPSAIYVSSDGEGDAGNLTIKGNSLILKNGGQLDSGVTDVGNGGDVTIDVEEIKITGVAPDESYPSALYVSAEGEGDAGNLTIKGNSLIVQDGGQLDSGVTDVGNGGDVTIDVGEIKITGVAPDESYPSALYVSAEGEGDAGNLTIKGNSLIVRDGGQIDSATLDEGNAGDIDIIADSILVTGSSSNGELSSRIIAASESFSIAGSIDITTKSLNITDDAAIAVSNTDFGDAGNLTISAEKINLKDRGSLNAEINRGKQGNIYLISNNIFLNNESQITARAFNNATGGNITIDTSKTIVLLNNSKIIADAVEGNGGSLEIITQGYFVSAESSVSASSEFGLDGNVEIETVNSDRSIEVNALSINSIDASEQITTGCSIDDNFTIAGKGGLPDNPLHYLRNQTTWQDLRTPEVKSLPISKGVFLINQPSIVKEAKNWLVNSQGNIELISKAEESDRSITGDFSCKYP